MKHIYSTWALGILAFTVVLFIVDAYVNTGEFTNDSDIVWNNKLYFVDGNTADYIWKDTAILYINNNDTIIMSKNDSYNFQDLKAANIYSNNELVCTLNNACGLNTTGNITGAGTTNYIPVWLSSVSLGNSYMSQASDSIGIHTAPLSGRVLNINYSGLTAGIRLFNTWTTSSARTGITITDYSNSTTGKGIYVTHYGLGMVADFNLQPDTIYDNATGIWVHGGSGNGSSKMIEITGSAGTGLFIGMGNQGATLLNATSLQGTWVAEQTNELSSNLLILNATNLTINTKLTITGEYDLGTCNITIEKGLIVGTTC